MNARKILLSLLFAMLLCPVAEVQAQFEFEQKYEWIYRPPRYDRKVGRLVGYQATPFTQYDALRKRTFVAGDPYDVHYTTDEGRTWAPMFDTLMWYLDFVYTLQINRSGTYVWYSTIYHLKNYMNILSDDGGRTWRMAIVDTLRGPFENRDEQPGIVIEPSFHAWQANYSVTGTPEHIRGVWVTADKGHTFKRIPYPAGIRYASRWMSPDDSLVAVADDNYWYVAHVVRDTAFRRLPMLSASNTEWGYTPDGTIVGIGNAGVVLAMPGGLLADIPRLPIEGRADSASFLPIRMIDHSRHTKIFVDGSGGIAMYKQGWASPRIIVQGETSTALTSLPFHGFNDTLFVYSCGIRASSPQRRTRYVVIDVRSLQTRLFETDGPTEEIVWPYPMRYIAPLSPDRWVVHNFHHPGIIKATSNAGQSWRLLDIPNRIDFAPHTYAGVRQLLPMGNGAPVLRTAQNAVLVPSENGYDMALETAFSANLRRGREYGVSLIRGEHLDNHRPSARVVYGDQPLVQYDDTSFVTTGGALLRYSVNGAFLDTVFQIQNTHFNRLDNGVWVLGGDSTWFTFNQGKEWVYVSRAFPHRLGRQGTNWPAAPVSASITSEDGAIFVGRRGMRKEFRGETIDSIIGGLLRTTDNGNTWAQVDSIPARSAVLSLARTQRGTLLCLSADVIHMPEGKAWIDGRVVDDWFYGRVQLHRSTDHGRTWRLASLLRFDPEIRQVEPKIYVADDDVYIVQPNSGVFQSTDDGLRWKQLDFTSLAPTYGINDIWRPGDGYMHFATDSGYARMKLEDIAYTSVEQAFGQDGGPSISYYEHSHELVVDTQEYVGGDIVVVDMRGSIVFRAETPSGRTHRLPPLPSGAYVAAVRTPQGVTSMPLIIAR